MLWRSRLANARLMAYPRRWPGLACAVAEELEPRLLLSTVSALRLDDAVVAPGDTVTAVVDDLHVAFSDPMNTATLAAPGNWSLLHDGGDGSFADGNETAYALTPTRVEAQDVRLDVASQILPAGLWRLTATGLKDAAGEDLDGDGDGTPGDPYTIDFTVAWPATLAVEGADSGANDALAAARPLAFAPYDPAAPNDRWIAMAQGARTSGDGGDYWSFTGLAGQTVTVHLQNIGPVWDSHVYLRNSADGELARSTSHVSWNHGVVRYTLPSSGTYYVQAVGSDAGQMGQYLLTVDLVDSAAVAIEWQSNDNSLADALGVQPSWRLEGLHRLTTLGGKLGAWGTNNNEADADYYSLGYLNAGATVTIAPVDWPGNDVAMSLSLYRDDGTLVGAAGEAVTIPAAGRYVLRVDSVYGNGPLGFYQLDVDVLDAIGPRVVSATRLPSDGQTTSLLLADWTLTVDEALDAASVAIEHITLIETGSGAAVPLTVAYDGDRTLTLTVDGAWRPLQSGLYRLSVDGLTDVMGNALDGDADGTGGDPYVHTFTVAFPVGVTVETVANESIATATEVPWTDGGIGGYWSSQACGSLSPTGDGDYWKVWLDEGDGLTAYVESPYSGMSLRPDLYNAASGRVLDGYGPIHDGRYEDSVFYGYTAPASDWYYVAISRYDGVSDEYRLHLTRTDATIAHETDTNHDNYGNPDVVAYALSGNQRLSSIAGFLMGWDDQTPDHDRYALGQLTAGDVVELTARTPTGSTAAPLVGLYDANWNLVADEDGVPWDGHVRATIPATGVYYAWVNTWEVYQGHGYLFNMSNQTVHDAAATAATYGG
ncbi:MAG: hypothetical protein GX591_20250, partial [Planctomycetes bacterium]|nr:hypothetical protein [Planctomycetota bacterium]